jgi:chromosome condensin MukBEF ATPase and DNA-binding subunit MukB
LALILTGIVGWRLAEISLVMATWATAHKRTDAARAADLLARAGRIADELTEFFESTPQRKFISDAAPETGRIARLMHGLAESELWIGRIRLVLALVAADPDEAASYFNQALQASRFVDRDGRSEARSDVAKAIVTIDPERAFDIAKGISSKDVRSGALCEMAQTVAAFDYDQAVRMLAEAEQAASKVRDKISRAAALYRVAEAIERRVWPRRRPASRRRY